MLGSSNPLRMGLYLKVGSLKRQLQLSEAIWVDPESNMTNIGPHPNGVLIRRDRDTEDGSAETRPREDTEEAATHRPRRAASGDQSCFGHL